MGALFEEFLKGNIINNQKKLVRYFRDLLFIDGGFIRIMDV